MAFIAPFRGVRYNPEKISDIRSVVAPPYDVSPEELQDLRSRSPYNVVHIDLPRKARAVKTCTRRPAAGSAGGWSRAC